MLQFRFHTIYHLLLFILKHISTFIHSSMAGYGNKKATDPTYEEGDDSFRFGRHTSTDPYVDAREYGSGTTGGAGFGMHYDLFDSYVTNRP